MITWTRIERTPINYMVYVKSTAETPFPLSGWDKSAIVNMVPGPVFEPGNYNYVVFGKPSRQAGEEGAARPEKIMAALNRFERESKIVITRALYCRGTFILHVKVGFPVNISGFNAYFIESVTPMGDDNYMIVGKPKKDIEDILSDFENQAK